MSMTALSAAASGAIGVLAEVLVARRVQQVDHVAVVLELEARWR